MKNRVKGDNWGLLVFVSVWDGLRLCMAVGACLTSVDTALRVHCECVRPVHVQRA